MPYSLDFVKSKYLKKWEKLDAKQKKISIEADGIFQTSAVGQAPPCYHRTLDKILKIEQEKAVIWNEIRGFIVPETKFKSLWEMALQWDKDHNLAYYDVHHFGEENHVSFTVQDIEKLYCVKEV